MNLFAYGTLMWPEVLEAVIGRRLHGTRTVLKGYARWCVKGACYPVVIPAVEHSVGGVLYEGLTEPEFEALDTFEGEEYDRVEVDFSGTEAVVYVLSNEWKHIVDFRPWNPQEMEPEILRRFGGG